jgi:hypothetical protein
MMAGEWTIDELVRRVGAVLAAADYPGAPNGRVRDVPDRRAIRWYTTIGLLDRPGGGPGRTARYGPRHLLQLVAIKRRQAQGHSLADIQAELVGATDARLRELSAIPEHLAGPADAPAGPADGPAGGGAAQGPAGGAAAQGPPGEAAAQRPPATGRSRFWSQPVPATQPAPVAPAAASASRDDTARPDGVRLLAGVPLGGGATLLLPAAPAAADLPAIRAAARPLLDLLAGQGLLTTAGPRTGDPFTRDRLAPLPEPEGVPDERPAR